MVSVHRPAFRAHGDRHYWIRNFLREAVLLHAFEAMDQMM